MTAKNKQTWNEIIKFLITVLTAVLSSQGLASCR